MYLLPWIYLIVLIMSTALLFSSVFTIIIFTDLECDYMNPIEACEGLNKLSNPELVVAVLMVIILGIGGGWIAFFWILVFFGCCIWQYINNRHIYDPTSIYTSLEENKKLAFVKLSYHLISFLLFLCLLISSIVD